MKSRHGKGDKYLEKKIQAPIVLPEPLDEAMQDQLRVELLKIIGRESFRVREHDTDSLVSQTKTVYNPVSSRLSAI